jgi:hypothetical protein
MGAIIMFILIGNLFINVIVFMISDSVYGLGLPTPAISRPAISELESFYKDKFSSTESFKTVDPLTYGVGFIISGFAMMFDAVYGSTISAAATYTSLFMMVPGALPFTANFFATVLAVVQNAIMFFGFLEFVGRYTGT